jgi:hypothetical protein
MFRLLLSLVLLVGFSTLAPAQSSASVQPEAGPVLLTTADTVRALHYLFAQKRRVGGWLVGGSAAGTAVASFAAGATYQGGFLEPDAGFVAIVGILATSPAWVSGLIKLDRFSRQRERAVLATYERTQQLPPYVRRRLVYEFF